MTFDFDTVFSRLGTHNTKWEFIAKDLNFSYTDHADPKYGDERVLPLWVADMDFRSPPAVIEALVQRAQHGIFGYSSPADDYYETVINWFARRYGWQIKRDWIVITHGVVPTLNVLVQSFVAPGEKVIVQPPVYYPFFKATENNGGVIVRNRLVLENGHYRMDFDDLAEKAADPAVKMAILCSPHNPVGRVWTAEELTRFGEICLANDVLVIADEVHCDLIMPGNHFTSFANLGETYAQKSIVCTSPSKSFNLAGLKTSNIIVPDPMLREQMQATLMRNGMIGVNAFGVIAAQAAFTHGDAWLTAVMDYIAANYRFMVDYLAEHLPQLKVLPLEGTYLAWVDCRALDMAPEVRKELFMETAKVYLDEGELFGPEGTGFERFNIACPRSILVEALERIRQVIQNHF